MFGHQRKERKERYRALSSSQPMQCEMHQPEKERKPTNEEGTHHYTQGDKRLVLLRKNSTRYFHFEIFPPFATRSSSVSSLLSLWAQDGFEDWQHLSHLRECSPPRWQKENFWRASSRPRWSCQGSSDRALLERNSATRSDFYCPSPLEFEFADLGKSSPPPSATPPSRTLLALFVASWGRIEGEICLYKSIHQFSPEMLICWRKLHISCHWHCLLLLYCLPGGQDVMKQEKSFQQPVNSVVDQDHTGHRKPEGQEGGKDCKGDVRVEDAFGNTVHLLHLGPTWPVGGERVNLHLYHLYHMILGASWITSKIWKLTILAELEQKR